MRVLPVLLASAALAAACSGSSGTAAPSPSTSSAAPSAGPTGSSDPYAALQAPTSPGIGDVEASTATRMYLQAQGLLAEAVLEKPSVLGTNAAELARDLAGTSQDTTVTADLGGKPTSRGLGYRPLFARGTTVGSIEVVRSEWDGEAVQGLSGESATRISWSGALRYHVTYQGTPTVVAYALKTAWIFELDTRLPGAINLVTTVLGGSHITPEPPACAAKGVIVPVGPAPTDEDYTEGPYPAPKGYPAACP